MSEPTTAALPGMPEPAPLVVDCYGEDGEYFVAEGHRDKAEFFAEAVRVGGLDEHSASVEDVKHCYWRDAVPSDGEQEYADGWKFWHDVTAANGDPITMLKLDV